MQKEKIALVSLLLILPLLLGNSPAPYPYPREYKDYTATPFVEHLLADETYRYTTTITNTGTDYIAVSDTFLLSEGHTEIQLYPCHDIILPATSYELIFNVDHQYEITTLSLVIQAYEPLLSDYTARNFKNITRETYDEYGYIYNYEMDFSVTDNEYYYGLITVYEYEGVSYASSNGNSIRGEFFYSQREMDPEAITITNVLLSKGRSKNPYGALGKILTGFLIVLFIMSGFSLFLMIAVPITLTVYFIKRRKSREVI